MDGFILDCFVDLMTEAEIKQITCQVLILLLEG